MPSLYLGWLQFLQKYLGPEYSNWESRPYLGSPKCFGGSPEFGRHKLHFICWKKRKKSWINTTSQVTINPFPRSQIRHGVGWRWGSPRWSRWKLARPPSTKGFFWGGGVVSWENIPFVYYASSHAGSNSKLRFHNIAVFPLSYLKCTAVNYL